MPATRKASPPILIKRACENVIIVDAEYDPSYQFEGYFKLRASLQQKMHAHVSLFRTGDSNVDAIRGAILANQERPASREEIEIRSRYVYLQHFSGRNPILNALNNAVGSTASTSRRPSHADL